MQLNLPNQQHSTPFEKIAWVAVTYPLNRPDGVLLNGEYCPEETLTFIQNSHIRKIYVQRLENLSGLARCPFIEHLRMEVCDDMFVQDYTPLYTLSELKGLQLVNVSGNLATCASLDVARFPKLELYCGDYRDISGLEQARNIRTLSLSHFYQSDVEVLSNLSQLDTLQLNTSSIRSLKGLRQLSQLQCLYLHYNRTLKVLDDLACVANSLKALRIENCPQIEDFSVLYQMEQVELLELSGSNVLSSLDFLKGMKSLKTLIITMNIADGNLKPCQSLLYAYVGKNRRHYNLKNNSLPQKCYVRGNENIDEWRRLE